MAARNEAQRGTAALKKVWPTGIFYQKALTANVEGR